METTTINEKLILDKLKNLKPKQQQQVINFIDFLQSQKTPAGTNTEQEKAISVLESASDLVGCINSGQGNLSLKKQEFKRKSLK